MVLDNDVEVSEWKLALDDLVRCHDHNYAQDLLKKVNKHFADKTLLHMPSDYVNSWHHSEQSLYPGDKGVEQKISSLLRWNATIMVLKAQLNGADLGGHIGTYASSSLLYEVGFNHFWKGSDHEPGDCIYYQGHASPGIYARSFLEYRFSQSRMDNFRREVEGKGLSSYPHPWLMPQYWQFPTVSMGLGPLQAIYQARLMKYLQARGLAKTKERHVWCFCGDGEMDEPESLGAIHLASRENLDNLIFVINCNLQRLDGPVRGNGKIVVELEKFFKGASWTVVKALWDSRWDNVFDHDVDSLLASRLSQVNDGNLQSYLRYGPKFMREHLTQNNPSLEQYLSQYDDDFLSQLGRAGHDEDKVYHAYKTAVENKKGPTVILVQTIKGYGLGEAGEALNTAHNTKKIDLENLKKFRDRFDIPVTDKQVESLSYARPAKSDILTEYLLDKRQSLKGQIPVRTKSPSLFFVPEKTEVFNLFDEGTGEKKISTTMAFVRLLGQLLKDKKIKDQIVPIVPDEARTFGMEGLFRQVGIYSSKGQQYKPVDADQVMFYKETTDGQIFQEGINEAGSMASWLTVATSYNTHQAPLIPFYIYYSMFGFQRIGDLAWAAGDSRAKGFLLGGTAGRTTLHGEGLQHQDGHSHLMAQTIPNCKCFDPAFAFEVAAIIHHGLKDMQSHDVFYYITLMNENYQQLKRPDISDSDIVKGMYLLKDVKKPQVDLLGSGTILNEVLQAQKILQEKYDIEARVFSVTSYSELRAEALKIDYDYTFRGQKKRISHIEKNLKKGNNPVISASDYVRLQADMIRPWVKRPYYVLGTDGFGRSDLRSQLRKHFAVSAAHIVWQALFALYQKGDFNGDLESVRLELGIDKEVDMALVL